MSGITLVFGENPEAGVPTGQDGAVEPREENLTKKWPLEETMYVKVFKDAIATILESESFLLCEAEVLYLKQLQTMPIEALYILIRLALRKNAWHRKSDYGRYAAEMDHEDKLDQAVRTLCCSQYTNIVQESKGDTDGNRNAPIDLTCDSDAEDDVLSAKVAAPEMEQGSRQEELDLSYHALSHDQATPQELLDMLTMDELNRLARDYNVKTTNRKRKEVTEAIVKSTNSQSTLSFFSRSKPLQQSNGNVKSKSGGRLKELCLKPLVHCLKLNPQALLLIRRINLLFFRTTNYEAQLFVPALLVACKKRTYSFYNSTRTNRVFESREALLKYEEALNLETEVEGVLEKLHASGAAKKLQGTKTRQDLETKLIELYNTIIQRYNDCLGELREDQRYGLERFEAGYVYARTLYHIAFPMGKIDGVDTGLQILRSLLGQTRWLLSKRGGCYDRIACIYMKDLKNRANVEKAHDIVTHALTDDETRFRYRPKLVRRLTRLENALEIPAAERHTCAGKISKCEEVYILGERIDHIDEDEPDAVLLAKPVRGWILAPSPVKDSTQAKRRYTGKTLWEGGDRSLIGVEELALEHYARDGFKGKHCEGRITRFLFALLFHDILFHPSVPGAFETTYQNAPLDLVHDTFYSSRKALIDARLEELLLPGWALEIIAMRDNELRGDNVFFVGGRWDAFERGEIMEIVECMPEQVIHDICLVQAQDFEASGGGVPDLILWNVEREEVKFVEVKSTNDKLSETQKLWIHHLVNAGAAVEVCHVETPSDRIKREEMKKRNRERAKSRTRSQSVASTVTRGRPRRESLFEEEEALESEEDGAGGDAATSDWETRDVDAVKSEEEEEDVKPYVRGKGRKRVIVKEEDEDETSNVGSMRKRLKTE